MDQDHDITRPAGWQLKFQDPCIVQKYNKHLGQAIEDAQSLQQLEAVYQEGVTELTTNQINQLEQLDRFITKAKCNAEQQCRKIHAGRIPWTPSLMIVIYKTMYWQGIKKQISGRTIRREVFRKRAKLSKETFLTMHLQLSKDDIIKKLCQATQDFKMAKKASERWDTWLGQMIAAQGKDKNIPKKRLWQ